MRYFRSGPDRRMEDALLNLQVAGMGGGAGGEARDFSKQGWHMECQERSGPLTLGGEGVSNPHGLKLRSESCKMPAERLHLPSYKDS